MTGFALYRRLAATRNDFIVLGDLNAKLASLCKQENHAGAVLDEILAKHGLVVLNDKTPTYYSFTELHEGVLDLAICTPNLANALKRFAVLPDERMGSDHAPILVTLERRSCNARFNSNNSTNYNFKKADWRAFAASLSLATPPPNTSNVEELNTFICTEILKAANHHIPPKTNTRFINSYPRHIVELIAERKKARRLAQRDSSLKPAYNSLTNQLRKQIIEHRDSQWNDFLKSLTPCASSSRPFWCKINKTRNGPSTTQSCALVVKDKRQEARG